MAAQLGHEAAAGAFVKPPSDQLVHALVTMPADVARQGAAVFFLDRRPPTIAQSGFAGLRIDLFASLGVEEGAGVVTVPQGPDMADLAEYARLDHFQRV